MKNILVVDDDPMAGKILVRMLRADYRVQAFVSPRQALSHFMEHGADIVITDLKMPEMDGMELLGRIKEIDSETMVFIVTGYASVDGAVRAMKMGAQDYLAKPFNPDDVLVKLTRAIREQRLEKQCSSYRQREDRSAGGSSIITGNEQMLAIMAMARKAARTDSTILILGETGVGKELLVKKIHSGARAGTTCWCRSTAAPWPGESWKVSSSAMKRVPLPARTRPGSVFLRWRIRGLFFLMKSVQRICVFR